MFAPKTTSSGEQLRNSPPVRRDSSTSSSVRRLVEYGPLTFAFEVAQVVGDRRDYLVGNLRAAGPVEEDELGLERREPRPYRCNIESHRAHGTEGIRTTIASWYLRWKT